MAKTSQIKSSELEMRINESDTWLVMKAMTNAYCLQEFKYFPKRRKDKERVDVEKAMTLLLFNSLDDACFFFFSAWKSQPENQNILIA